MAEDGNAPRTVAGATVGVKQSSFKFVVSITHVAPPEHFVYDRKKSAQQMQIIPLEQKLQVVHFVMFLIQVSPRKTAKLCLVFAGKYVHAVIRFLLRVVTHHS